MALLVLENVNRCVKDPQRPIGVSVQLERAEGGDRVRGWANRSGRIADPLEGLEEHPGATQRHQMRSQGQIGGS